MQANRQLHRRHGPEDVHLVLATHRLVGGVED